MARQQKNMDKLCSQLSSAHATCRRNRSFMQAQDLAKSEALNSKKTFEELLNIREQTDKQLVEKYSKKLPALDPDKKKSSFFKRLFSRNGLKMLISAALAGGAITTAIVVPPLGLIATLGLSISAAASSYAAISSFIAICNPNSKEVLQTIDDIRHGIKGDPTELSRMSRESAKTRHEKIIKALKRSANFVQYPNVQNTSEHVLNKLTNSIEKAKAENNGRVLDELSIIQKSVKTVKTVIDVEKQITNLDTQKILDSSEQPSTNNAKEKIEHKAPAFNYAILGIDVAKYNKADLKNLKNSPQAVQELATYQLKSLQKTHEREQNQNSQMGNPSQHRPNE